MHTIERRFVMRLRLLPAALAGALLLIGQVQVAAASDAIRLTGHFTQHFGGRNSEGIVCADDAINCGAGKVDGRGRATDAFYFSDEEGFRYAITLQDGSRLTVQLDFIIETKPGGSGDTPQQTSYGNPDDLYFDAVVIAGTGVFAGATGGGVVHLSQAGNVDQISPDLELVIP